MTTLHCTALHGTAIHSTALQCTAKHCNAMQCTVLHCTWMLYNPLHCTALLSHAWCTPSNRPRSLGAQISIMDTVLLVTEVTVLTDAMHCLINCLFARNRLSLKSEQRYITQRFIDLSADFFRYQKFWEHKQIFPFSVPSHLLGVKELQPNSRRGSHYSNQFFKIFVAYFASLFAQTEHNTDF